MSAAAVAAALGKPHRNGAGWVCVCPAHDDHEPSLSVSDGDDGRLLVKCHAGCDQDAVVGAIKERGLWPEPERRRRKEITATYDYRDAEGRLRYQVVRFADPKTFKQRRPDGSGWTWNMKGVAPLPYRLPELLQAAGFTVFIVEGEKDADRLAALNQIVTTNHGGAGKWSPKISPYLAGLDVVILPDNDDAGRAHAEKVARLLKSVAKRLRVLALPGLPPKGDVSDWIAAGGTNTELHRLAEVTPDWTPTRDEALVLNPRAPLASARIFAERRGVRLLRHHAGSFYEWQGTRYDELDDGDVEAMGYAFLEQAKREYKAGPGPFNPERADIEKLLHALRSHVHLPSRIAPPVWLAGDAVGGPLTACANGLLRLSDGALLPHSPDFFNTSAVEFAYDPAAPAPGEWLKFLASLWGDDQQSIDALQEMFGYIVAADLKQQKMFLLVGPPRSGKGTIARVLTKLVGRGGHVGLTLASLSKNFGLQPLINKSLVIVPDARLRGGSHEIVERLLAISGEDTLTIDRKHKTAWTGRLPGRIVFLTNEVPALADNSGAIASRFIIFQFAISFLGREDLMLEERLTREMPGILNWAMAGWRRLVERGHFVQPVRATASMRLLDTLASPIKAFLDERCDLGANFEIRTKDLFNIWLMWCQENGRDHPGNEASFGRDLHAARPEVHSVQRRLRDGENGRDGETTHLRIYAGVRLRSNRPPERQWSLPIDGAARAAADGPPDGFDVRG